MKKKKKLVRRVWITLLKICFFIFLLTIFQVISLKYIDPFFTPNTAWEWAESIIEKDVTKQPRYIFKPLSKISPHLKRAVIAAEDQRFLIHHGLDFNEINNAIKTLVKKKKLRGASTISMQTARSVFLLSSRSALRKVAELYYTLLIELFWDKSRILEMYLNTVDWGTHITGAEAASLKYFEKSADSLTIEQAALMTAALPNPHRWSVKNPTPYLKNRQQQILKDIHKMPLL